MGMAKGTTDLIKYEVDSFDLENTLEKTAGIV